RGAPGVLAVRTLAVFLSLASAAAAQTVVVTGTFRYEDKPYTDAGFTTGGPAVYLPVRRAEVDLVRDGDNFILGSGVTNDAGAFSISYTGPNQLVHARLYAKRSGGKINVSVRNNTTLDQLYSALSVAMTTVAPAV